jgi:hypothetical protein
LAIGLLFGAGCGEEGRLCDDGGFSDGLVIFLGASTPGGYVAAVDADGAALRYGWTMDADRRPHAGDRVSVGLGGSRILSVGLDPARKGPALQLAITAGGRPAGGPRHVALIVSRDGAEIGRKELTVSYDDACHPGSAMDSMPLD